MRIIVWGVIGFVLVAALVEWRRRWLARADALPDQLIKPPKLKFEGADESLQARAEERRANAEEMRRRAALIESGGVSLSVVKKRA